MAYPNINSIPGTQQRNLGPVTEALLPLVEELLAVYSDSEVTPRVLELASHPYTHILSWAKRWPSVEWWGSARDTEQIRDIEAVLGSTPTDDRPPSNLRHPIRLDIQSESDWTNLRALLDGQSIQLGGVIMLNLIHCCPLGVPEEIFKHLSGDISSSDVDESLLHSSSSWVAAYGPWKNDDGTYKSDADKAFEESHIRSSDPSLGLRSIQSITSMAERHGFIEDKRVKMPAGNVFVVWRRRVVV
ncbi:hypothetical protein BD324DRAFT_651570 [Kockovaella imperatae]|uniref:Uncharacterized protein n=1 Tax=Kockovaella imperatae TaxID=4999 RepID=A0A1Y1UE57_9TREE|nr:hypothetical protein BD324DRAFT_651570 [Kockovaella imperatae]ORX36330.1 hypothetical protein BD324DRAFT_651570 [Kockovaella imperatae]